MNQTHDNIQSRNIYPFNTNLAKQKLKKELIFWKLNSYLYMISCLPDQISSSRQTQILQTSLLKGISSTDENMSKFLFLPIHFKETHELIEKKKSAVALLTWC